MVQGRHPHAVRRAVRQGLQRGEQRLQDDAIPGEEGVGRGAHACKAQGVLRGLLVARKAVRGLDQLYLIEDVLHGGRREEDPHSHQREDVGGTGAHRWPSVIRMNQGALLPRPLVGLEYAASPGVLAAPSDKWISGCSA